MPAVSKAQQRAMYAAAEGHSTLGIPESVGKEFVAHDERVKGASVCFVAPDGRILFLHRTDGKGWDIPGGHREAGETTEQNALREAREETGGLPYGELAPLDHQDGDGVDWTVFRMPVRYAFTPKLSDEHDGFRWSVFENRPGDMMTETEMSLTRGFSGSTEDKHPQATERASDCLAFDRASVRTIDKDGRLHVALTHISKANVCPYRGDEIPDPDGTLNLDPDRIYMLLRDPEELEKGAPTSNGIQVMSEHIGVSADEPQKMLIAGATGNDARFNAPYLDNSLVVWDADLLRGIEDGSQQQISCSYYYRADMTAGRYEGVSYDGIMRDIVFNHVAIVPVGRAGPDVLVGDSLSSLTGVTTMGKSLSKKAAMAKGALLAILKPKKLAADKALDLDKVLAGVTTKNWLSKKPGIIAAIKPSLAKDADLDDVVQLIDALDKEQPEESDPGEITVDEDPRIEKILSLIRGKVSDEDLQAVTEALKESAAEDEDEEERRKREEEERKAAEARKAATDEPDQTTGAATAHPGGKPEDEKVSKSAMDAAIATERARSAKALREVEAKTIERLRSIASAEEDVRPYVGKLAVAMDSAEAVFKTALETMGVDVAGIHPSAYRAVLMAHPKPGATQKRVANDASMTSSITDAFPNAARLR
jgi:hypothetical protein